MIKVLDYLLDKIGLVRKSKTVDNFNEKNGMFEETNPRDLESNWTKSENGIEINSQP